MPKRLRFTVGADTDEVDILYTDTPGGTPDTLLATIQVEAGEATHDVTVESTEGRRWAVKPRNTDAEPDVDGNLSNVVQEASSPVITFVNVPDATVGQDYTAEVSITDADGDLIPPLAVDATLNDVAADSVSNVGDVYSFTWLAASLPVAGTGYVLAVVADDEGNRHASESTTVDVVGSVEPDAINTLAHLWTMDEPADVRYDHKGEAHLISLAGSAESTTGLVGNATRVPSAGIRLTTPHRLVRTQNTSFSTALWFKVPDFASRHNIIGQYVSNKGGERSWVLEVPDSASPRIDYKYTVDGATEVAGFRSWTGENFLNWSLLWVHYDAVANTLNLAVNARAWAEPIELGSPLFLPAETAYTYGLDFGAFASTGGSVRTGAEIDESYWWDGYKPTDDERTAIYNAGAGRDKTYFDIDWTPPASPLSNITLVNDTFFDAGADGNTGAYYLRPYPLKDYDSALATANGDYVRFRSTDHSTGGIRMGFSNSPAVCPSSWSLIIENALLVAADPGADSWGSVETPHLVYNPDDATYPFYMYCHAGRYEGGVYTQLTHILRSADLVNWIWYGKVDARGDDPLWNHTGYFYAERLGTGNWWAASKLNDSVSPLAYWTSTDGLNWTLALARDAYADSPPVFIFGNLNTKFASGGKTYALTGMGHGILYYSDVRVVECEGDWGFKYPGWRIMDYKGTGVDADWLQDRRAYIEGSTLHLYVKIGGYQTNDGVIRYYTADIAP